jgi:hypothetical protein
VLGRPWPAPGEPLFLAEDTDGAMALQWYEGLICSGCGQPLDESMSPEAEDGYRARLLACHGCAELQKAQTDLQADTADPGLHIVIERAQRSRA